MQITIQEGIKDKSGVYKITFSNGMFYIGCAGYIKTRIEQHSRAIKSKFKHNVQAKCFLQFSGLDLDAHFELIQEVDTDNIGRFEVRKLLMRVERLHLSINHSNKNLINRLKIKNLLF